ncbi:fimbria/pilus periplasmic chaperone [Henriciella sp. AS95]|uniref:fimbrial biogenesis chaperone n=1 Tax=Henriciella sp. AS95 TaxID=3135782 RepID=UPI0031705EDA
MHRSVNAAIGLSLVLAWGSLSASAFEVQPMRHSVYPESGQTTGLLTVKNTRSKPLPVELVVEKRVFGENGEQTLVPADDDFIIFPFQALIEPGAKQAFRFQYVGDQTVTSETAYTIHVREVPVELEPGFTGLRYVYSFGVVVYVENARAESELSISDVVRDGDTLKMTVKNSGNSFGRLTNDRLILSQGDTKLELEGESFMSIADHVVVPPENQIPLTLNLSELNIAAGDLSVSLEETPD